MKLNYKKKFYFGLMALFLGGMTFSIISVAKTTNKSKISKSISADNAIVDVKSYGFVDLEGAKTSAVIVEYNQDIKASSVDKNDYEIIDYVIYTEKQDGFEKTIELDKDSLKGNEGQITKVYVNDKPEISKNGGTKEGKYVVIEVNTAYMLTGQNLSYTSTMMAGVKQIGEITGKNGKITAGTKEVSNYTLSEEIQTRPTGETVTKTVITTDKNKIILPEFDKNSGWKIHYIGNGGFKATKAYSEYTGKYEDFEMPYAIYVPNKEVLEKNKGNISVVLHMEHAGANDTGEFSKGSHMSTWKYGYQVDYPFEWLFEQRRETAQARGKVEQLKNKWLGRDKDRNIKKGSGTAGLNTAQYTLAGKSDTYTENWKPYDVVNKLINDILNAEKIVLNKRTGETYTKKSYVEMIRKLYNLLSKEDKKKVKNYNDLIKTEK